MPDFASFEPPDDVVVPSGHLSIGTSAARQNVGRPPNPEGGVAVCGDAGTGKTSLLARLAQIDDQSEAMSPLVIDAKGVLPSCLTHVGVAVADLTNEPDRVGAALRAGVLTAISTRDRATRLAAIGCALQTLADHLEALVRLSLLIDDAEDIIDEVATVAEHRPPHLGLTVSWRPSIAEPDAYLIDQLYALAVFQTNNPAIAKMLNDRGDRMQDPQWNPRQRTSQKPLQ